MIRFVLFCTIVIAVVSWLKTRPRKWIYPSDMFFLVCVIINGLTPLFNPYAVSETANPFVYSEATVDSAQLASALMFVVFAGVWWFRPVLNVQHLFPVVSTVAQRRVQRKLSARLWWTLPTCIMLSLILLVSADYREFKIEVLRFIAGNMDNADYIDARRLLFADSVFMTELVARLRYTIFPVLIVGSFIFVRSFAGGAAAMVVGIFLLILGPASVAKMPLAIFTGYLILTWAALKRPAFLRDRFAILMLLGAFVFTTILLSGIYYLQYPDRFRGMGDYPDALMLSFSRTFLVTYADYLKYFEVYPHFLPFAGLSSINLVSSVIGVEYRNIDVEVPIFFMGSARGQLTTFPTVFIGAAYAAFGYTGVAIFSAGVAMFLSWLDWILLKFKNYTVRVIGYATLSMNVTFLAQLAAPTALLTYGCLAIPAVLYVIDRFLMVQPSQAPIQEGRRAPLSLPTRGFTR